MKKFIIIFIIALLAAGFTAAADGKTDTLGNSRAEGKGASAWETGLNGDSLAIVQEAKPGGDGLAIVWEAKPDGDGLERYGLTALCAAAPSKSFEDAETDKICALVNQFDGVSESVAIGYGDNLAIALKTKGIFLASQERRLKIEIEDKVLKTFPQYNNVYIMTRVKDFYVLKGLEAKINEGANPLEIYKLIIELYKTPAKELPKPPKKNSSKAIANIALERSDIPQKSA